MADRHADFEQAFIEPVIRTGRATMLAAAGCCMLPGLYLYLYHDLFPPLAALAQALVAVWSFAIVLAVIEPAIYFPMLGIAGTYMSFLTGNILNVRVPASVTAQDLAGTKQGTPEAEVISALAVSGSVIAGQIVLVVGALAFIPLIDDLRQAGSSVAVALEQVLPALFGALGGAFLLRMPKLGAPPVILGLALAWYNAELPYAVVIPPMVVISVVGARLMYRRGIVKSAPM